jgi:superfamily II DNA or RNA helicase
VLCSIVVLGVGFDEPCASCTILARPTLSLSMHIQQIGRVLRTSPGKKDALVLDHAGNVLRHGKVEDFDPPPLCEIDKRTDKVSKAHTSDAFPCPECRALMGPGQRVCGECGHEVARQNTVDFIPGELVEGKSPRRGLSRDEFLELYCELRGYGEQRGFKDGWAYMQLKNRYQFKAPYSWKHLSPTVPSQSTLNLAKSWLIAYRKAQQRDAGRRPC